MGGCFTLSRRGLLAGLTSLLFRISSREALAQDEATDGLLERESAGRLIRVGSPATGAITTLPLEVYVARVLAAEGDPRALDAAREALAIAIRTYALVNERRHARDGYDLCDTTHCQVVRMSNSTTRRSTLNTALQVLTFEGRPAELYYSASCGGYSERAGDVWSGVNYPYLQARPDPVHDDEVPWTLDLSLAEAASAMKRIGYVGDLAGVIVASRTASSRAGSLRLEGLVPDTIGGNEFRLAVGPTRLRSTLFSLISDGETLRFVGRGYGHGVGMCAVGAGTRALRGESAAKILAHYYPGLALVTLDPAAGRASSTPRPQPFPVPR